MSASFAKAIIPRRAVQKAPVSDTGWELGWSFAIKTEVRTGPDGRELAGWIPEGADSPTALRYLPDEANSDDRS